MSLVLLPAVAFGLQWSAEPTLVPARSALVESETEVDRTGVSKGQHEIQSEEELTKIRREALVEAAASMRRIWGGADGNRSASPNGSSTFSGLAHESKRAQLVLPCYTDVIELGWILRLMASCLPHPEQIVKCADRLAHPVGVVVFVAIIGHYHFIANEADAHGLNEYGHILQAMSRLGMSPAQHVMIHIGDEWELRAAQQDLQFDPLQQSLRGIYRFWGSAFRQFDNGEGRFLPLGWTSKFATVRLHQNSSLQEAPSRHHALTFVGTARRGARANLLSQFAKSMEAAGLSLNQLRDGASEALGPRVRYKANDQLYVATMANSAFCLDLPGASSECYRLYEALEVGCIPVVTGFQTLEIWARNAPELGPPPFLVTDPAQVGESVLSFMQDPTALRELQLQSEAYWQAITAKYSTALQHTVCPAPLSVPTN